MNSYFEICTKNIIREEGTRDGHGFIRILYSHWELSNVGCLSRMQEKYWTTTNIFKLGEIFGERLYNLHLHRVEGTCLSEKNCLMR